jgi:hypothetical protein
MFSFTGIILRVILLVLSGNGSSGYSHCVSLVRLNNPIGMFFICPILATNAHEIAHVYRHSTRVDTARFTYAVAMFMLKTISADIDIKRGGGQIAPSLVVVSTMWAGCPQFAFSL